jgi:hypothetical protein
MISFGLFLAGFGAGWVARSAVDSSRGAVVATMAAAMGAWDRVQRAVAMEREHLEDLVAEARAQHEASKARRAAREAKPANVDTLHRERAA